MNALTAQQGAKIDVSVPVLKEPVAADWLVALLRSQLESMGLPRVRRNDFSSAIRGLERYLMTLPAGPVAVDEALLNACEDWLVDGDDGMRRHYGKATSHLRRLVNALPATVRNRPLLTNRETRKLDRFADLSPESRQMLKRFLADGRKVKRTRDGLASTSVLLSHSVRQNAAYAATMVMRIVGLDDIRLFGSAHAEQYLKHCGEDGRETATHTMWNARCLFRWLLATGVIKEDPLAGIGRQGAHADTDFVPAGQVAKLADLAMLDVASFRDVRDRLIAYALCYDLALRIGEVARLRMGDVRVGDFVEVALRSEVQKGSAKPAVTLRNLFPESKTLFEAYLRLREPVGVTTDWLLVSEDGKPLLVSGCRNAVKRISEELGIVTDAGRTPAPHRYRHSLGTLNVGELGMRLTPYYLMRRYRHNDIRTTMQVYVASNPLLDEAQHVAIVNAANGNGNGHASNPDPPPRSMAADIKVPEQEAMARVRSLGVNWRSLREHAIGEKAVVERQGKVYYSAAFLDALCTEWMTRDEAMRLMGLSSPTAFHNRVRNHGIGTLVIGRASLAKTDDVVRSLRRVDPS